MHLILLGPAGSGKGTLARMLVERNGYIQFDTGAALRRIAEEPTREGRQLKAELAKGNMAPTPMVMEALARGLAEFPEARFVLDGIPRNPEQTEEFLRRVRAGDIRIDRVLVLDAARELLRTRLLMRRTCGDCGSIFNLASGPRPVEGRCHCGGGLGQRADDHADGIQRRFDLYDAMTVPAIEMLRQAGLRIIRVDASVAAEETYRAATLQLRALAKRVAVGR